jgi:hypothetical protein
MEMQNAREHDSEWQEGEGLRVNADEGNRRGRERKRRKDSE